MIISLISLLPLWGLSRFNYLVFHTIIEMLAVVVGATLSIFALSIPKGHRPYFLDNLAITYLNVIVIDFLHTLAFKGMGVFPSFSANHPTQFWILGRSLETIGLVSIASKKINPKIFLVAFSVVSFLGIYLIFRGGFPDCFIEGKGLTLFKIAVEYIIIFLLIPLAIFVHRSKDPDISSYKSPLILAIIFTILAEVSFTLYTDVYGFFNMLGHLFRFISYLVILVGIINISITEPLKTLYRKLDLEVKKYQEFAVRDPLTRVYNKAFFEEKAKYTIYNLLKDGVPVTIAMADIDNFKNINDTYSHLVGDRVLRRVGETLRNSLRSGDIVIRYGGDEFLIFLVDCDSELSSRIIERIKSSVSKLSDEFGFPVSLSIGTVEATKSHPERLENLIEIADKRMYEEKEKLKSEK
ncbi:MAG: diguanylate cyclase [Synergistetes bacterium]|nr:diguanylate cyclase [Synergistota bacterium]MDW8191751.1 MASE3 domain-containing protein [Synergistota bacterium]